MGTASRGWGERDIIYCVLMSSFDVPPLFAVCTPGSPLLDSDWLLAEPAGGAGGGWGGLGGVGVGGGGLSIFQVTRSSQLLLLAWEGSKSSPAPFVYPHGFMGHLPTSLLGPQRLRTDPLLGSGSGLRRDPVLGPDRPASGLRTDPVLGSGETCFWAVAPRWFLVCFRVKLACFLR